MDQVASGFADADVGLGLASGHPELGPVAEGALADVFADGFTAGLRLCLDSDLLLLGGTESHPSGLVDLKIVGVKILLFHTKWCINSATDASLRAGVPRRELDNREAELFDIDTTCIVFREGFSPKHMQSVPLITSDRNHP